MDTHRILSIHGNILIYGWILMDGDDLIRAYHTVHMIIRSLLRSWSTTPLAQPFGKGCKRVQYYAMQISTYPRYPKDIHRSNWHSFAVLEVVTLQDMLEDKISAWLSPSRCTFWWLQAEWSRSQQHGTARGTWQGLGLGRSRIWGNAREWGTMGIEEYLVTKTMAGKPKSNL